MIAKRKPATSNKYEAVHPEYGTAEQRLASGISQEGDVNALLTLMNYMQPRYGASIYDTPSPQSRAYMVDNNIFVQRPSDSGGYTDRGFKLQSGNVGAVTGYAGDVAPSDRRMLNSLLQNPDVVRYFMDIYGEGSKSYPRVRRVNSRPVNDPAGMPDIQRKRKVHDSCKGNLSCYG